MTVTLGNLNFLSLRYNSDQDVGVLSPEITVLQPPPVNLFECKLSKCFLPKSFAKNTLFLGIFN